MAKTHLRPQTGGDPAQGPAGDLTNQSASPSADNDFPDAPEQSADDKPQDKPDLDAFARRMGTDTIETGEGLDAVPEDRSVDAENTESKNSRLIIGAAGAAVAALLVVVLRRRKRRSLLSKAVALGAAVNVIRS